MTNQNLIKQYVDTGIRIPEYQFSKLSDNLKKTYLRKRMIGIGNTQDGFIDFLEDWEFNSLDNKHIEEYKKQIMNLATSEDEDGDFFELPNDVYDILSTEQKKYLDGFLEQKRRSKIDSYERDSFKLVNKEFF